MRASAGSRAPVHEVMLRRGPAVVALVLALAMAPLPALAADVPPRDAVA